LVWHRHLCNVMVGNITFLWFLQFLMQYCLHYGLIVVCYIYYLARSANLPKGLYIVAERAIYFTFCNFFLFLNWAKLSQDLLDRFSRFISPNGRYLCECFKSGPVFPIPQATLPWQPICVVIKIQTTHEIQSSNSRDDFAHLWMSGTTLPKTGAF